MATAYNSVDAQRTSRRPARPKKAMATTISSIIEKCARLARDGSVEEQFVSCWALVWLGKAKLIRDDEVTPELLQALFTNWRRPSNPDFQRMAAWAFCAMPLLDLSSKPLGELRGHAEFLRRESRFDDEPFQTTVPRLP